MVLFRFPDPEYAEAFRAYSNYIVDISAEVAVNYGWNTGLVEGVIDGVSLHLSGAGIQRRILSRADNEALETTLRRSWAYLRRLRREVDDIDSFDEESNAWLPVQAYYAVYNAIRAYAVASGQSVPVDHRKALNLAAKAAVIKKFWRRFRDHGAKYQNWHGELIDRLNLDENAWLEMWQGLPDLVEVAAAARLRALYVDVDNGEVTDPSDIITVELAHNTWKSVTLVVEPALRMWQGADLPAHLEKTAPKARSFFAAMTKAREEGDRGAAVASFNELFGDFEVPESAFERASKWAAELDSEEE